MTATWFHVPLGKVLTERRESPDANDLASGAVPIISKIGFNDGQIQLRIGGDTKTGMILVRPGDLVVSGINAAKGAIAIYEKGNERPIAATIHYGAYIPNSDLVDTKYLWWLLRSTTFRDLLMSHVPGGIKTKLKAKRLLPIPVPMPPLSEQRRIVAHIEALAAQIAEARGMRQQAGEEAERIIVSARAIQFKEAAIAGVKRLDEVANLHRGRFSHRPRNDPRFFGGDHPWIQIAEIEAANKYIKTWSQTLNDRGLAVSRKFPSGTLLISIAATIGAVGILTFDCCIPDSIVAVIPRPHFDSEYLYHYLGYIRTNLEQVAPQNAQKNINLEILAPLPVPALGLDDQRRIVSYLDDLQSKVDALKRLQVQTSAELDALLPSILDKAFKGEL